jgi:hypothetical protein
MFEKEPKMNVKHPEINNKALNFVHLIKKVFLFLRMCPTPGLSFP